MIKIKKVNPRIKTKFSMAAPFWRIIFFVYLFVGITSAKVYAETCAGDGLEASELLSTIEANGWGLNTRNTRHQNSSFSNINRSNVADLEVQWVRNVGTVLAVRSQPAVTQRALFYGTQGGSIVAVDRASGCEFWKANVGIEVRTAITMAGSEDNQQALLFFGDFFGSIYAMNAVSGEVIWKQSSVSNLTRTSTGSPVFHRGVLYVPVSSLEVGLALIWLYPCCRFQGHVSAFNAYTGEPLWSTSVMDEEASLVDGNPWYQPRYAPAGAPVWTTPAIDVRRNRLYIGTGQGYTSPASDSTDAILALDLDSGEIVWKQQMLSLDAWNIGCLINGPNCPEEEGPDFDFGASPILIKLRSGQDMLYVGQKSGDVFALDPDNEGQIIWQTKVSEGGNLGGVHWGMATDHKRLYVPITDKSLEGDVGDAKRGVYALDLQTGDILWSAQPTINCGDEECIPSFSSAVMVTDELLFAGDLEGNIWAFDSSNGEVLWQFDTDIEYPAIDDETANGGAIDMAGQVVVGDNLYVMSGYGLYGKKLGNAFISFSLP